MNTTRLEPALRVLTVIFTMVAVAALLWPASIPRTVIAPAGIEAAPTKRSTNPVDPAVTQAIVAGNVFSAARTAPRSRYNPFEPEPASDPPAFVDPAAAEASAQDEDAVPRLYGIVSGPAGTTALMRLDPSIPEAQLYREGDRAGRYRVVSINDKAVVLSGPRGQTVLQLKRPEGP
jgi:hypothetical protein